MANKGKKSEVTYLNVDALAPPKKTLTFKGVTHEMHQVNVEEFIQLTTASTEVDEIEFDQLPMPQKVERLIKNIRTAFPSIDEQDLRRDLTLEQLTTIIRFIAGQLEQEAEAVAMAKEAEASEEKNA